jgi:hypothetical protein
MFGRSLTTVLVILVCLAGLIAPVLVDAHHWWSRRSKKKKRLESSFDEIACSRQWTAYLFEVHGALDLID